MAVREGPIMPESDWTPDPASLPMEEAMEAKGVCEEDRDEVRRFAEVLRRLRDKRAGKTLPPAPKGMREWIEGTDL